MSNFKSHRTPRIEFPRTPERAMFIDRVRNRPLDLAILSTIADVDITTSSADSIVAGAIFDTGIQALRDEISVLSYAEEAADPNHKTETAAMRRRTRRHLS